MNKEIKFRAWLKNEKKMVDVCDISFKKELIAYEEEYRDGKCLPYHFYEYKTFDEIEIMQYIGKSDVHNVDICVGDIVKVHYEYESYDGYVEDSTLCIVKYVDEWCRVIFQYLYDKDGNYYSVEDLDMNDVEIVGNVWEHKHLYGEQNDS